MAVTMAVTGIVTTPTRRACGHSGDTSYASSALQMCTRSALHVCTLQANISDSEAARAVSFCSVTAIVIVVACCPSASSVDDTRIGTFRTSYKSPATSYKAQVTIYE